jgi:hypothetical protein
MEPSFFDINAANLSEVGRDVDDRDRTWFSGLDSLLNRRKHLIIRRLVKSIDMTIRSIFEQLLFRLKKALLFFYHLYNINSSYYFNDICYFS